MNVEIPYLTDDVTLWQARLAFPGSWPAPFPVLAAILGLIVVAELVVVVVSPRHRGISGLGGGLALLVGGILAAVIIGLPVATTMFGGVLAREPAFPFIAATKIPHPTADQIAAAGVDAASIDATELDHNTRAAIATTYPSVTIVTSTPIKPGGTLVATVNRVTQQCALTVTGDGPDDSLGRPASQSVVLLCNGVEPARG